MTDSIRRITRALISVSDKSGLVPFAEALAAAGVEIVSTGGTAAALAAAGLPVRDVAELTGFPEMMDGRVKTLHPAVHGGLLAIRDSAEHQNSAKQHGIEPIDLLVVSLYPFEATIASGADFDTSIENIDIGGPAMIRAAAKNFDGVAVVVDPDDYERVLAEMRANASGTTIELRRRLAAKAYARTAAYDAAISRWFAEVVKEDVPTWRSFGGRLAQPLRYGENPHQTAAFYHMAPSRAGVATAHQHQGKELSYNNLNDTDAAFELVAEFDPSKTAAVAIIKHANPCGVATGATLKDAYEKALRCDPVSAFGGIIALNGEIDAEAAEAMTQIFTEVVIAPGASDAAREIFAAKKNLRLLTTNMLPDPRAPGLLVRSLAGGLLVQSRDDAVVEDFDLKVVTKRQPTEAEFADMRFAFKVAKHVKSNAIVYARQGATVGIGAGQMSRVDSTRIAAWKAGEAAKTAEIAEPLTRGSVVASDAFFPFADGLIAAADAGATAVIQPGGSMRDEEVIAAADARNLAMVFTGIRHFRH
ncbi:bifunctional phosphoribosylaminoimidazolecarboxamide formyltransferase/IMP cyclohydrolase [Filomicrobium sp.]|uniref:bifunctional phosphoribosylaminoimidazolecarboxamide formyltransferase/IMP cyclohydrolase n=1 Tax=Filomicrobium sp. TaxID=2024831 RepID=UPI0025862C20|nr:bifunctional phosphoribosylaminoimidazolecarboxamide formyltransferase/IMP cyclohydrolase [Filomicrobium sp.]MCV0368375.1 bifunctional phosphoribosylaminoimidazolecarboxamide formyltransferase/IMP cyclohydrolase [Filomicrobium sp.]